MLKVPSSNLEVVKKWCSDLWEVMDAEAIASLPTSGITIHGQISDLSDWSDYAETVAALSNLLHNITFDYADEIEQGERVAARLIVRAQQPVTERPVCFSGHFIARVVDGRMCEINVTMDYMKMFEQLGQLPEEPLAICLTGARLVWAD